MKIWKISEKYLSLLKILVLVKQLKFKQKKGGFLWMFLGTLDASLLGNLLTRKGAVRASKGAITEGESF